MMKRLIKLSISLSVTFILFGVSESLAKQHHHLANHHDQDSIVSPFDGLKKTSSPHCLLMSKFHHRKGKCPHSKAKRDKTTKISVDCGGKTSGSIPNQSTYTNNFGEFHLISLMHPPLIKKITIISSFSSKHYIDLLVPPPRFV